MLDDGVPALFTLGNLRSLETVGALLYAYYIDGVRVIDRVQSSCRQVVGSSAARLRTWPTGNRVTRHGALRRRPGLLLPAVVKPGYAVFDPVRSAAESSEQRETVQ